MDRLLCWEVRRSSWLAVRSARSVSICAVVMGSRIGTFSWTVSRSSVALRAFASSALVSRSSCGMTKWYTATCRYVAHDALRIWVSSFVHMQPLVIDYEAPQTPYKQIAAWIKSGIESGELAPNKMIPSEKDIMDMTGVARTTVRRAIQYLRDEGVVYTVAGRGTYASGLSDPRRPPHDVFQ
jgi:GntR family transcriptional regulator